MAPPGRDTVYHEKQVVVADPRPQLPGGEKLLKLSAEALFLGNKINPITKRLFSSHFENIVVNVEGITKAYQKFLGAFEENQDWLPNKLDVMVKAHVTKAIAWLLGTETFGNPGTCTTAMENRGNLNTYRKCRKGKKGKKNTDSKALVVVPEFLNVAWTQVWDHYIPEDCEISKEAVSQVKCVQCYRHATEKNRCEGQMFSNDALANVTITDDGDTKLCGGHLFDIADYTVRLYKGLQEKITDRGCTKPLLTVDEGRTFFKDCEKEYLFKGKVEKLTEKLWAWTTWRMVVVAMEVEVEAMVVVETVAAVALWT